MSADREARRAVRQEEERQKRVAEGLELELVKEVPEGKGEELLSDLKAALDADEVESVKVALKNIGDTIHSLWGDTSPTKTEYFENDKYQLGLSTGTSGTRLIIQIKDRDKFFGKLIFPNVHMGHKKKGVTLADVFQRLFGDKAVNIQPDSDKPYYVVNL